jgi:hypothetical protein
MIRLLSLNKKLHLAPVNQLLQRREREQACVKISDEPVEAPPTSQQEDAGSSCILGGGKHPFPFAQKTYSRRTQRQVKPRVLGEDKKPETTEELVEPVQPKDHSPKVIPPSSSSSEDNVSQYKIVMERGAPGLKTSSG